MSFPHPVAELESRCGAAGAARDGGCDGMDVPWMGRRSQAHRGADIAAVLGASWRQAEQPGAAGFVLAQVSAKWVCSLTRTTSPQRFFSLGRSAVTAAAAMVRAGAGLAWKRADMESEACQLIRIRGGAQALQEASTVDEA